MARLQAGGIVSIWYNFSFVPHDFWTFSFLCWSNMLLLNLEDLNILEFFHLLCQPLSLKKDFTNKILTCCTQKKIFMMYRQQISVANWKYLPVSIICGPIINLLNAATKTFVCSIHASSQTYRPTDKILCNAKRVFHHLLYVFVKYTYFVCRVDQKGFNDHSRCIIMHCEI